MLSEMKYIVILGDGMADLPIQGLDWRTPLEAAHTPAMDELASLGEIGMIHTIPDGMKPGSDTAILFRPLSPGGSEYRRGYEGDGCGPAVQCGHAVPGGGYL